MNTNHNLLSQDGEVYYIPRFYSESTALELYYALHSSTSWQEDDITLFGKTHKQPRLTALYGDKGYSYSGITMKPNPWTPVLIKIKEDLLKKFNKSFNVALLNLYRSGRDSNGWHSDNEPELGENPYIISVSFGETRRFRLRHKFNKDLKVTIDLAPGSVLIMSGATQSNWNHCLTKTAKEVSPRINITFRTVF